MRAPPAIELVALALWRRVPTVDWPRQRMEAEGPARGVPVVDPVPCSSCGACARACPAGCIDMLEATGGGSLPVVDAGPCVRCGLCEVACAEGAISLTGPAMVVHAREGLVMDGRPQAELVVTRSPSRLYREAIGPGDGRPVRPADALLARARSLEVDDG